MVVANAATRSCRSKYGALTDGHCSGEHAGDNPELSLSGIFCCHFSVIQRSCTVYNGTDIEKATILA